MKEHGVTYKPWICCRITQVYDSGCCIYFYCGFTYRGLKKDPLETYMEIENSARDVIMRLGGSISHHHGIGKIRKRFMKNSINESGMEALRGMKKMFDPNNIFATNNLV